MALETVADLIARVEAAHPASHIPSRQLAYFEAVHQELAPLARALERRLAEVEAELLACQRKDWTDKSALRRVRGVLKSAMVSVFTCPSCSNEYRAGTDPVTVYADRGHVNCRACNPRCLPQHATVMNERLEPRCPTSP